MKLKTLSILAFASVLMVSCLKSRDSLGLIGDEGTIITEIADINVDGDIRFLSLDLAPAVETVTAITLRNHAARTQPSGGTVHVKLNTTNNAAVTNAGLTILPANGFTLGATEFDIPAGGSVTVPITFNKNNLDLSKQYGIAFRISEVNQGIISDLAKEIVVAVVIKNAYHADYEVTGFFFHPSAPREIHMDKGLATLGAVRSKAEVLGDLAGWQFAFDVSGTNTLTNWEAYGATPPAPGSGFMSSDNPGAIAFPGPELPGTPPYVHSTYNNSYNPATKTFWMHYGYNGTSDAGRTRQIYEKWVRH